MHQQNWRSSLSTASGQTPRVDNKYTYRGISDRHTYYSNTGPRLQSRNTIEPRLPHFCSPHLQPGRLNPPLPPPDKQTALFFSLGKCERKNVGFVLCVLKGKKKSSKQTGEEKKRGGGRKRDSGYLSCSWKCHCGCCNKSHGVVMCLFTVRCIAAIHTLIFSPGLASLKHTRAHTHTALSSWSDFPLLYLVLTFSIHCSKWASVFLHTAMRDKRARSHTEHCIWTESFIRCSDWRCCPELKPQGLFIPYHKKCSCYESAQPICKIKH